MRGLGSALRALRESRGLRLKDTAERSGFSESYVSQVEREVVLPSVTALGKLAEALGVNVSEVFDRVERAQNAHPTIVRVDERKAISVPGSDFENQLLTADLKRRMEPVLARGKPGAVSGIYSHEGEEFAIVLKGQILLRIDQEEFVLAQGDAVHFESRRPH